MTLKLKYNHAKDTFNLKGLTAEQLELIGALMNHVRFGSGELYRDAAFELSTFLHDEIEPNFHQDALVYFTEDTSGFGSIEVIERRFSERMDNDGEVVHEKDEDEPDELVFAV